MRHCGGLERAQPDSARRQVVGNAGDAVAGGQPPFRRGKRRRVKARQAAGRAARRAKAQARASDLAPVVKGLQAAGFESLRAIAAGLDERGIPAARGGKWSAVQVARLLGAAGLPFGGSVPVGAGIVAA